MLQLQKLFNKFSLNKFITKCASPSNVKSVLNNRYLLYGLSLLVLLDLIYLANSRSFNTIIIFILVGFLTSFFCKNMIVIMLVALFVAHVLKSPRSFEGAENMNEEAEDNKEKKEEDENYENKDKDESEQPEDEKIKEELKEFATVQNEIIAGLTKLEPLINKADSFIEKFEKYSK
jgi:hypothetical protein